MLKSDIELIIKSARRTYIIEDPYPDHSFIETLSDKDKKRYLKTIENPPEDISIYRAYREGMNFAFDHMESYLIKRLVRGDA